MTSSILAVATTSTVASMYSKCSTFDEDEQAFAISVEISSCLISRVDNTFTVATLTSSTVALTPDVAAVASTTFGATFAVVESIKFRCVASRVVIISVNNTHSCSFSMFALSFWLIIFYSLLLISFRTICIVCIKLLCVYKLF